MPLPNIGKVCDYFLWRQEDAHRNSLNAYCYWTLRKEGLSKTEATAELEGKSVSYKNELLFSKGINYNDVPNWQKRGIGVLYRDIEKEGFNPVTNETVKTMRRAVVPELDIPIGDEYRSFILKILAECEQ